MGASVGCVVLMCSVAAVSPSWLLTEPGGTLRLTVAPPAADFVLAPVIAEFIARYPDISLDVSIDHGFVDIVEARFDAGIRPGRRVERDMIAVRISDELPFVVAAKTRRSASTERDFASEGQLEPDRVRGALDFCEPARSCFASLTMRGRRPSSSTRAAASAAENHRAVRWWDSGQSFDCRLTTKANTSTSQGTVASPSSRRFS